jgi:hypothetical protein
VTRALCLALALSSCAPSYAVATRRTPPLWLFAADMVAFSAGCIVGINEFNKPGPPWSESPNRTLMYGGFGVALAAFAPYWIVSTK